MRDKATIKIRVDKEIKKQVIEILDRNGLDLDTAVELFLKECIKQQGIPFEIRLI